MFGLRLLATTFACGLIAACGATTLPAPHPESASLSQEDGGIAFSDAESDPTGTPALVALVATEQVERCPNDMAIVNGTFCIDRYEASLVESRAEGDEAPFPHYLSPDGKAVRAVSVKGAIPQTFISEVQASAACEQSGKRLCKWAEWKSACGGSTRTTFPYGATRSANVCHDSGRNPVATVFPEMWAASLKQAKAAAQKKNASKPKKKRTTKKTLAAKKKGTTLRAPASKKPTDVSQEVWTKLNDPRLGQVEGAIAPAGTHEQCVNDFGVFDMVGNVHEWVATDLSLEHGTFAGGYFLDTSINGEGCNYATRAHAHDYHDYSTGFRCCRDVSPP